MHDTYIQSEFTTYDLRGEIQNHKEEIVRQLNEKLKDALIKQFQAYVKELEAKKATSDEDGRYEVSDIGNSFWVGHNCAIDLAIDKANNFIKYLEQR